MTRRAMLDTNIVSALMRDPRGAIRRKAEEFGLDDLCISIIVAGELEFGIAKSGSRRIRAQFDAILKTMEIVPVHAPTERLYGEVRAHLLERGKVIGPNDVWIAAHALALGLTLVTGNIREFSRVPRLRTENWLD